MEQRIGRYQILEEIAAGGQGTVYRAFDPDTRQIIALKVLHPTLSGDRGYIERFRREASLAASIDHPNVVKIFEVGQDGDRFFMALEFLPESLARVIETGPQMPIDTAAQFCLEVAEGLAAAHALGIVHRDVKPQNVLIGPDGTAKVTDFGIARAESLSTMTATGVVMGTPHYMSPEQSRGERADARSDIYSLGCMLYQMLAGQVPFKGDTPVAVIRQQIDDQPRRLRELRRDLPRRLGAVVERSMAKDPRRRYQSTAEMAQALRAAVPGLAGPARTAAPRPQPASPTPQPVPDLEPEQPPERPSSTWMSAWAGAWQRSHRRRWAWVGTLLSVTVALTVAGVRLDVYDRAKEYVEEAGWFGAVAVSEQSSEPNQTESAAIPMTTPTTIPVEILLPTPTPVTPPTPVASLVPTETPVTPPTPVASLVPTETPVTPPPPVEAVVPTQTSTVTQAELDLDRPSIIGYDVLINGYVGPENIDISRVRWDWGDGNQYDGLFPQSHEYAQPGTYTIRVTTYNANDMPLISRSVSVAVPGPTLAPSPSPTATRPAFSPTSSPTGTPVAIIAPSATPSPAPILTTIGTPTLQGKLLFNGRSISRYTQQRPTFEIRDRSVNQACREVRVAARTVSMERYDPATGEYAITGLNAGNYCLKVTIDAAEPFNADGTFPGDYAAGSLHGNEISLASGEVKNIDFEFMRFIHMVQPVENGGESLSATATDEIVLSSPMKVEWDQFPEAASYLVSVHACDRVPCPDRRLVYRESLEQSQVQLELPPNDVGEIYWLFISAFNNNQPLSRFLASYGPLTRTDGLYFTVEMGVGEGSMKESDVLSPAGQQSAIPTSPAELSPAGQLPLLGRDDPPEELGEVVVADGMSDQASGLTGGEYRDGVFVLQTQRAHTYSAYYEGVTLPSSFSVEADIMIEGTGQRRAGLMGWSDPGYLVAIDPHFTDLRVWPSETIVSEHVSSPLEDIGGFYDISTILRDEWNHLRLISHGTELWVYLNRVLVSYSDNVPNLSVSRPGFHVSAWGDDPVIASFDNFVLRALASGGEVGSLPSAAGAGTAMISDGLAASDTIAYSMTGVTAPATGKKYVGWLVSDDGSKKLNTGTMALADDDSISHTFDSSSSRYTADNLIHLYNRVVITLEDEGLDLSQPVGLAVFSHEIPTGAMAHIRHLLTNWPPGADNGILTNLKDQLDVAILHATLSRDSNTIEAVHQHAHHVINIIEGADGPNFDASFGNPGDGVGVLAHAADRKHALFAAGAAPDDVVVTAHAALVDMNGKNAEDWATLARDAALKVLGTTDIALAKIYLGPGGDTVLSWLQAARNGIDANGNGTIESIAGEGGTEQAYVAAQKMAIFTLE